MDEPRVLVALGAGACLPEYRSALASGADLRARLDEHLRLAPGERRAVPTGIRLELPAGWEGQIRPRSGLALEKGVTCLNSPGTVDADYRGELKVILVNLGEEALEIHDGDRIAQLVIVPVARARFEATAELSGSARGDGGFGSTGRR